MQQQRTPQRPQSGGSGGGGKRFDLKDYIQVQDRINEFWEKYPDGSIITRLESPIDNFKETRYSSEIRKDRNSSEPDATGWAFELAGAGMANKTSHEENCETSAIGRALANMGFAVSASKRASREEMAKVQRMTEEAEQPGTTPPQGNRGSTPSKASDKQLNFVRGLWKDLGYIAKGEDGVEHHDAVSLDMYCTDNWQAPLNQMTKEQAGQLLDALQAAKAEREGGEQHVTYNDQFTDAQTGQVAPF